MAIGFDEAGVSFDDGTYTFDGDLATAAPTPAPSVPSGFRRAPEFVVRPAAPAEVRVLIRRRVRLFVWVTVSTVGGPAVETVGVGVLRTNTELTLTGPVVCRTACRAVPETDVQVSAAIETAVWVRPGEARTELDQLHTDYQRTVALLERRIAGLETEVDELELLAVLTETNQWVSRQRT